jgi:hypothetical protein
MHAGNVKCIKILVNKPEGKKPLGCPKRRWRNYIKNGSKKRSVKVWTALNRICYEDYGQLSASIEVDK